MRNPRPVAPVRYDRVTILLHWATVALVVLLWLIGRTADWAPRGPLRAGVWSAHVTLGATAALVLVARLAWRLRLGRALSPADEGALQVIAKATHVALYLLLVAVIALGVANARFQCIWRGAIAAAWDRRRRNAAQHQRMARIRGQPARPGRFGAHAGGFRDQYVWRDRLIDRMLP
jgi:cytochrome b561